MASFPTEMRVDRSGKLVITWDSNTISSINTIPNAILNGTLNFQYGFNTGGGAVYAPSSAGEQRGKVVGQERNLSLAPSFPFATAHEMSVPVPASITGGGLTGVLGWRTPNNAGTLAPLVTFNPSPATNINTQNVNFTTPGNAFSNYAGPATDIRLNDLPAISPGGDPVAQIFTDTGTSGTTLINWTWSGARYGRVASGALPGNITVLVNGISRTVIAHGTTGTSGSQTSSVTVNYPIAPTDTVTITIPDGHFELSQNSTGGSGIFSPSTVILDCVNSVNIPVINQRGWPTPAYVAPPTVTFQGSRVRFAFDQNVTNQNFLTSANITASGNFGGNRTLTPNAVGSNYIEYAVTGTPLYTGETVDCTSVAAGVVRNVSAPPGQGLSLAFDPASFVVPVGETPPVPVPIAAAVVSSGTQLLIGWDRAATKLSGTGQLIPTYSPVGTQSLGTPNSGNGTNAWTYNLSSNSIKIGDTVVMDLPASFARDTVTSIPTALVNDFPVINNSTQPYPKPQLLDADVLADGQTIRLRFDRAVHYNQATFESAIRVLARDVSSLALRIFTVAPGSGSVVTGSITNDTVQFNVSGAGTIFGNGIGGPGDPNDGDDVAIHSSGFAGVVSSELSVMAGQPALLDPIGAPTTEDDFVNSYTVDNGSTVQEPAAAITPEYVESEIYDQGTDQFLRIRFDDGAGNSIKLQFNVTLPTLTTTLTGNISLQFEQLQTGAGDSDEIVYRVTGDKVKRTIDGEVCTLTIPTGVVVSDATGTPNLAAGPFVDTVEATFTNNSTVPQPLPSEQPPKIQQIQVGGDGKTVGVYYDVPINAVSGIIAVDGTLTGNKSGTFTVDPVPAQSTLATFLMTQNVPIFRGETPFVDLPAGIVANTINGQTSLAATRVKAENNSLIPVPMPPQVDEATLNDPGTIIQATFNVPIVASAGTAYIVASKSGRHDITIESINANIANLSIAGIVFEDETLYMYFSRDFVREAQFEFTPNDQLTRFVVDVSARTSAAPDLPANAVNLKPEALN